MPDYTQCYNEGYNAYQNDQSDNQCPYPDDSDEAAGWYDGYSQGCKEDADYDPDDYNDSAEGEC